MKSKEEIEQLALNHANEEIEVYNSIGVSREIKQAIYTHCLVSYNIAYTQCQEDMADNMVKLANYLRNNYQPLAPNQAEWQRIKDKKVLRIEDIIEELNKQDI